MQLQTYSWPGNIRELRNVIERLVLIAGEKKSISEREVIEALPNLPLCPSGDMSQCSLDEVERLHIQRVLEASHGNRTQAAKILAIDYKTLLSKLKKYGLGG